MLLLAKVNSQLYGSGSTTQDENNFVEYIILCIEKYENILKIVQ